VLDAGKALVNRFIPAQTFRPATIDEWSKMQAVDLERFKAVSAAGGQNPSYAWVEAIVRLQRPGIGLVVLAVWAWSHVTFPPGTPADAFVAIDNAAGAVWFYLFGERTLSYVRAQTAKQASGTK
jgi:hypothetical protein